MSKDQKANAIKLIHCNEFRYVMEQVEIERTKTVEEKIVTGCLQIFLLILIILTVLVGAAIYYA